MRLKARAPLRIDFAGGWTDVPAFAEQEGGAVVNAAITRYVEGYISRPESSGAIHLWRGDRSYVSYSMQLPTGLGLGSSAAQNVLWLALVRTSIDNTASRANIAEMACRISETLGILGGKQDEYAAALGGIHYFTFDTSVRAQRLELSTPVLQALRAQLVLVNSGKSRLSGSIHEWVWSRYRSGDPAVLAALRGLKRVASDMRDALLAGDLSSFSALISENWTYQQELHSSVTNSDLDDLFAFARAHGARDGKACGAGGGGCCLFTVAPEGSDSLRSALRSRKLQIIDFDFDSYGVLVQKA